MKPISVKRALTYMNAGHGFVLTELGALREIRREDHKPGEWAGYVTCYKQLDGMGLLLGPGKGLTKRGQEVLTKWTKKQAANRIV